MSKYFGWDTVVVAIYENSNNSPSGSTPTLAPLISIFTECHLSSLTETYQGRAIGERGSYKIPFAVVEEIEIGALVDPNLFSLLAIKKTYGEGPFWCWVRLGSGENYQGRVIIESANLVIPYGPVTQQGRLSVQGELTLI